MEPRRPTGEDAAQRDHRVTLAERVCARCPAAPRCAELVEHGRVGGVVQAGARRGNLPPPAERVMTTDGPTGIVHKPADYTLWWPTARASCCQCGRAEFWAPPVLGLRDRGPMCSVCRNREPEWLQSWAEVLYQLDTAAMFCPDELRDGLLSSVLNVAPAIIEQYLGTEKEPRG